MILNSFFSYYSKIVKKWLPSNVAWLSVKSSKFWLPGKVICVSQWGIIDPLSEVCFASFMKTNIHPLKFKG